MKIGRIKKDFNWNYGIEIKKCPDWKLGFSPFLRIWFFKLKGLPPTGEMLSREYYQGLRFTFEPLTHFNIIMRTFRVGSRCYSLPISVSKRN